MKGGGEAVAVGRQARRRRAAHVVVFGAAADAELDEHVQPEEQLLASLVNLPSETHFFGYPTHFTRTYDACPTGQQRTTRVPFIGSTVGTYARVVQ